MINKLKIFIKRYGYKGCIKHAFYYLNTYLFYRGARLIRTPIEIRGKSLIDFGKKLTTGNYCRIEAFVDQSNYLSNEKVITFGNNVILNDQVHIAAKYGVTIGNDVLIASKVFISDHNHGNYSNENQSAPETPPNNRAIAGKKVIIEDNVWLGEFTAILPGVTIGKGSIIGAMSVVTKTIPPYCIAVGAPAKVIKIYNLNSQKWEIVN